MAQIGTKFINFAGMEAPKKETRLTHCLLNGSDEWHEYDGINTNGYRRIVYLGVRRFSFGIKDVFACYVEGMDEVQLWAGEKGDEF